MGILGKWRDAEPAVVSASCREKLLESVRDDTEPNEALGREFERRHSIEPTGVDPMFGGKHPALPVAPLSDAKPEPSKIPPVLQRPDNQQMRLIGKLEVLLSLAEKHRLMIEQQRRNIETLNTLNQRQSRELKYLRHRLEQHEHAIEPSWRRLFDRFARVPHQQEPFN